MPRPRDGSFTLPDTQRLTTSSRVRLFYVQAGIGSRALAYLTDWLILLGVWLTVLFILAATEAFTRLFQGLQNDIFDYTVLATWILLFMLGNWLYFVSFETLLRGQTPGKLLAGVRVVTDAGHPAGLGHAVLRTSLRLIDFLPAMYAIGLTVALASPTGKRLGDYAAGTIMVRERNGSLYLGAPLLSPDALRRPLDARWREAWRHLADEESDCLRDYLLRRDELNGRSRRVVSRSLLNELRGAHPELDLLAADRDAHLAPEAFLEDLWRSISLADEGDAV